MPWTSHVLEPRLWLIGAGVVEISDLLLGQRRLRIEIAYVEGALDVVLDPRTGVGDDPHRAWNTALARRAEPDPGAAVDNQETAFGVPPDRLLQCVELVAGQELVRALPDQRRLGDVRVAVEGREILGHRHETLNRHAVAPVRALHPTRHSRA